MEKGTIYKFFLKYHVTNKNEVWYARFLEISAKTQYHDAHGIDGEEGIIVSGAIFTIDGLAGTIDYTDFSEGLLCLMNEVDRIVPCDEKEIALYEHYEKNKDL